MENHIIQVSTEIDQFSVEVASALPAVQILVQDGGIQGPKGDSGGSYVHNQINPDVEWIVQHNLGYFPNVTVVDSGENMVFGDMQYIDNNSLKLTFSAAFSGKAYVS